MELLIHVKSSPCHDTSRSQSAKYIAFAPYISGCPIWPSIASPAAARRARMFNMSPGEKNSTVARAIASQLIVNCCMNGSDCMLPSEWHLGCACARRGRRIVIMSTPLYVSAYTPRLRSAHSRA